MMLRTLAFALPRSAFFPLLKIKIQPGTIPTLALIGLALADWTLVRNNKKERKERRVVWDMFDPQGHHSIQE